MKKCLKTLILPLLFCMLSQHAALAVQISNGQNVNDQQDTDNQPDNAAGQGSDSQQANSNGQSKDANYTIMAGDVLQITVWKEEGLDQEVLVLTDGTINFPLIGSVVAQGKSPAELQDAIKEKLEKLIPDAAVSVVVKAALGHTVSVIGQVAKPGEIMMGHGLTVMQALSQAGGLTPYASESGIIILHRENGKETSTPFPYEDIIDGEDLDKDIVLSPGDVVVVPTAGLL